MTQCVMRKLCTIVDFFILCARLSSELAQGNSNDFTLRNDSHLPSP